MKRRGIRPKRRSGFTLIEMLIVLGIVVMLLALIGPRLLRSGKQADVSGTKAQIKMLQGCLDQYCLHTKEYPSTEEGLEALVTPPAEKGETTTSRWQGPYTRTGELPKDPWGNEYQYRYPPENGKADLPDVWSFGPDGQDNTEDDVVSWTKSSDAAEDGMNEELDLGPEPESMPEPMPEEAGL